MPHTERTQIPVVHDRAGNFLAALDAVLVAYRQLHAYGFSCSAYVSLCVREEHPPEELALRTWAAAHADEVVLSSEESRFDSDTNRIRSLAVRYRDKRGERIAWLQWPMEPVTKEPRVQIDADAMWSPAHGGGGR